MTNTLTISRELLERQEPVARPWLDGCTEPKTYTEAKSQLADAMKVIVGLRDRGAEIAEKIKALCEHPSMSFHQVALLDGVLSAISDPQIASPPAPVAVVHTMKSVMSAVCAAHNFPMLTSNQCQSLADALNACLDKVKEIQQ